MLSRIHQKLGTAGFVISIVALVAALGGGAYAASNGLNSKQKKEVQKIAKAEAKKVAGTPGPAGPKGDTGSAGGAGPKGDTGAQGAPGANGGAGAAGKSVVSSSASLAECAEGGTKFEVEGSGKSSKACNGEEGAEGSPWTAGGTLPSNSTETGVWAVGQLNDESAKPVAFAPVSFTIPLAAPIAGGHQHYINAAGKEVKLNTTTFEFEEVDSAACLGTAAAPTATPGDLCVYTGVLENAVGSNISFVSLTGSSSLEEVNNPSYTTGTTVRFEGEAAGSAIKGIGTWAVTAP
jgi:hypothetical protein